MAAAKKSKHLSEKGNESKKALNTDHEKEEKIRRLKAKYFKRQFFNAIFIILIVGVVCFGGLMLYSSTVTSANNKFLNFFKNLNQKNPSDAASDSPAAVIDGSAITMGELDAKYATLPAEYQTLIPKEKMLEQLIDEKLLLMEAELQGIVVSDSEIESALNDLLSSYQMTREQLDDELKSMGITYDEFAGRFKTEIIITKLLNESIIQKVNLSQREMEDYYIENIEMFKIPESVNASHIIICHNESLRCDSNLTKEEAYAKISDLKIRIEKGEDFGALAKEFSEDSSKDTEGNLGFFSKGQMVPEFEDVAFAMDEGEMSGIVETDFGYHLIKLIEKKPEETAEFETVKSQIEETLKAERQQELYKEFIGGLKENADITVFYKEPVNNQTQVPSEQP